MGDKCAQKIVLSILKFMRMQLDAGTLSEDSTESLEVAIQCMESAYNVDRNAADDKNVPDLFELFSTSSDIWANEAPEVISEKDKDLAEKLKNTGNVLMKEEKFSEAIEQYTNAIALNPNNAVYYCNRAAAHSKLNNHLAAIQDCKEAVRLDSTYSKAYGRLGIAYSSLNKHEEAKQNYIKALQLEPENESYKLNLQMANEQLAKVQNSGQAGASAFDFGALMNNPALMSMASQMLNNPNMQNIMSNIMSMGQSDAGMDALIEAGQQLAEQMQTVNPQLIETLRRNVTGNGSNPESNPSDQNDQSKN